MSDVDLNTAQEIIDAFNLSDELDPKVSSWLLENAGTVFSSALNIEKSIQVTDKLEFRSKLSDYLTLKTRIGYLSWAKQEPLTSFPLGREGQTAQELFIAKGWTHPSEQLIIAHETPDFKAYGAMTRSPLAFLIHSSFPVILAKHFILLYEVSGRQPFRAFPPDLSWSQRLGLAMTFISISYANRELTSRGDAISLISLATHAPNPMLMSQSFSSLLRGPYMKDEKFIDWVECFAKTSVASGQWSWLMMNLNKIPERRDGNPRLSSLLL